MANRYKGSDPKTGILNRIDPSPAVGKSYDDDEHGITDVIYTGFRNNSSPNVPGKYLATVYRVEGDMREKPASGHLIRPEHILHDSINKEGYATGRSTLQLRIHIPELMPMMPTPSTIPAPGQSSYDNSLINTYPLVLAQTENMPVPQVGDRVWVEFQNINDLKTGVYVAPYRTTRNILNHQGTPASAQDAFYKGALASAGTLGGLTPEDIFAGVTNPLDAAENVAFASEMEAYSENAKNCYGEIPPSHRDKVNNFMQNQGDRLKIYKVPRKIKQYAKKHGITPSDITNQENPISDNVLYKMATIKSYLITAKGRYSDFYDSDGYLKENVACIEGIGYEEVQNIAEKELRFWSGLRDSNIASGAASFKGEGGEKLSGFNKKVEDLARAYDENTYKISQAYDEIIKDMHYNEGLTEEEAISGKTVNYGVYDAENKNIVYKEMDFSKAVDDLYGFRGDHSARSMYPGTQFTSGPDTFRRTPKAPESLSTLGKAGVVSSQAHPEYLNMKGEYVEGKLRNLGYSVSYTGDYTRNTIVTGIDTKQPRRDPRIAKSIYSRPIMSFGEDAEQYLSERVFENPKKSQRAIYNTSTGEVSYEKVERDEQAAIWDRLNMYWTGINKGFGASTAWSAAFISFLLSKSGFIPGSSHVNYVGNIRTNLDNCIRSGWYPFSLLRNRKKIIAQVGDVVVKPRVQIDTNENHRLGSMYTHGDVVFKIEGNKAYLCGGNTADSVIDSSGDFYDTVGIPHILDIDADGTYDQKTIFNKGYIIVLKRMNEPNQAAWMPTVIDETGTPIYD
tara:strand:- start:39093 stop:41465 length:2373 start_codon:yes stop_codon:yes gene_type:complete